MYILLLGARGLKMIPSYSFDNIPRLDMLVIPGGRGAREQMTSPKVLELIASHARDSELVASVSTGAPMFAKARLLRGKRATTQADHPSRPNQARRDLETKEAVSR